MSSLVDLREPDFIAFHNLCRPFTMTSTERLYSLFNAVHFVVAAGVLGDFVECGVWKGGSVMMMGLILKSLGLLDRHIYLFDTFEGMTVPTAEDVEDQSGRSAIELLAARDQNVVARSSIEEVRSNIERTGYPMERFIFVEGDV
jgi:O-methyltransferase